MYSILYLNIIFLFSIPYPINLEAIRAACPDLDTFYIIDLEKLKCQYAEWQRLFPKVHPYYAVKANSDQRIIDVLAGLGANFDCASPAEIDQVLSTGASPDRILYANPCKRSADIRYAVEVGVTMTTFDSVSELRKMGSGSGSGMRGVLRISASDPEARCTLSNKYGAEKHEWAGLLQAARTNGVDVVGVSFHVGSGASGSAGAYSDAISDCHSLISLARKYGFSIRMVDIGGGFVPGALGDIPKTVEKMMDGDYQYIAEPGRFFAQSAATLYTQIYGKRKNSYWIADGIYGSFNCILYDHAAPVPTVLGSGGGEGGLKRTGTIFGPTCDGLDQIATLPLPASLDVGDWFEWPEMGAYTTVGASQFNGMPFNKIARFYV